MSGQPQSDSLPHVAPATGAPLWREALIAGLAYYGILAALPHWRGVAPLVGIVAGTLLFLLLSLAVIRNIARWPLKPLHEFFLFAFPLSAWYSTTLWSAQFPDAAPFISPAESLLFLIACAFFGRLVARLVRDVNILVPIAIVLILVDFFTVFVGPTGQALDKAPELVGKLSVGLPAVGSAAGPEGAKGFAFVATAGLGDFIFLGFFFVAAWRYRLRFERTFWWIAALTGLGMVGYLAVPLLPGIPLLPFIALGFLIANAGAFSLSRQEKLYLLIAISFIAVLLAGGFIMMNQLFPEPPPPD
jgi:hypothetical protein